MLPVVRNFTVVIFGMLIGLVIAEGVSRITYTRPWYLSLLEEQNRNNSQILVRKNSFGLRDQDYPVVKPPNSKRVLILGDSFTFGVGVADDAAIFPELLEKQLNTEFAEQGMTIEILNGGIPASLTNNWVDVLEHAKYLSKFDVILIVFFLRDGTRTFDIESFFNPIRNELEMKNQEAFLYQYSYLFRWYQDFRDRTYLSEKYSNALNEAYLGGHEQTQEWEIAKANILRIKATSEEIDARVGLVVFPVLAELNDNYPFKEIFEVIIGFSTENGIPTHSLLPAFMGRNEPELWVSSFDQHPSMLAHEIAANSILPFLRQLLKDDPPH